MNPEVIQTFLLHFAEQAKIQSTTSIMGLLELYDKGPRTQTQLAGVTGTSTASVTGMRDRLVKDGLVEERRDFNDRRQIPSILTSKGEKLVAGAFMVAEETANALEVEAQKEACGVKERITLP